MRPRIADGRQLATNFGRRGAGLEAVVEVTHQRFDQGLPLPTSVLTASAHDKVGSAEGSRERHRPRRRELHPHPSAPPLDVVRRPDRRLSDERSQPVRHEAACHGRSAYRPISGGRRFSRGRHLARRMHTEKHEESVAARPLSIPVGPTIVFGRSDGIGEGGKTVIDERVLPCVRRDTASDPATTEHRDRSLVDRDVTLGSQFQRSKPRSVNPLPPAVFVATTDKRHDRRIVCQPRWICPPPMPRSVVRA